MKKIIIVIGVLTITSCGMFTKLTNEQMKKRNDVEYQLDRLYLEYSYERDSLILEYYKE